MKIRFKDAMIFIFLALLFYIFFNGLHFSLIKNVVSDSVYLLIYNISWVFSLIFIIIGVIVFSKKNIFVGALIGALIYLPVTLRIILLCMGDDECGFGIMVAFLLPFVFIWSLPIAAIAKYFWDKKK